MIMLRWEETNFERIITIQCDFFLLSRHNPLYNQYISYLLWNENVFEIHFFQTVTMLSYRQVKHFLHKDHRLFWAKIYLEL